MPPSDDSFSARTAYWTTYWAGKDVHQLAQAYGLLYEETERYYREAQFLRDERFEDGKRQAELTGEAELLRPRIARLEEQVDNLLAQRQWQREQIVALSLESHTLTTRIMERRSWPESPGPDVVREQAEETPPHASEDWRLLRG